MADRRRTRREIIAAGLCFCAAERLLQASDFWNKKDSSAWSTDEIMQLATKSPWARDARVLPRPGRDRGGMNNSMPDLAESSQQGRGASKKPGEVAVVPVEEVTVIWASGQPVIDALKTRIPAEFANHYVIGVNDLPKSEGGRKVDPDSMTATLQLHSGRSVGAGAILPGKDTTLFGFSKELFPLSVADKEVLFALDADQYTIKTYFNLREMTYRGQLAL
jgi:hypothetical protein